MRLSSVAAAPIVATLGVTQIVGYGSLYYAYPILAPSVAAEYGVGEPLLFGIMSAGLLLGGFVAPTLGRLFDRFGAAIVMTLGSLAMAILTALLSVAPTVWAFGALVVVIEVLSFAVLYDAAFATLAQKRQADRRQAITRLTLIAGFASTIFWPLTGWLVEAVGWRGSLMLFAGLHLFCAAPLHYWIARLPAVEARSTAMDAADPKPDPYAVLPDGPLARRAFLLLGGGFALTGMAISALTVHLVPVLQSLDLGEMAYLTAMVMGPAQVAIRVVDATLWRTWHPLDVAIVSAVAIPASLALLLLPGPAQMLAIAFAACFGIGAGLASIVRGAVPVTLFGTSGIGQRLGRLAAIRSVLGASAPFLFSWAVATVSVAWAVAATLSFALGGVVALLVLRRDLRRAGAFPGRSLGVAVAPPGA